MKSTYQRVEEFIHSDNGVDLGFPYTILQANKTIQADFNLPRVAT